MKNAKNPFTAQCSNGDFWSEERHREKLTERHLPVMHKSSTEYLGFSAEPFHPDKCI